MPTHLLPILSTEDRVLTPHDLMRFADHDYSATAWAHILFSARDDVVHLVRIAVASLFVAHASHRRARIERANWA